MSPVVQLRCATLPFIGAIALHYWLVVLDESSGECHRWEVWQSKNAGGRGAGHVHCDLKAPDAAVGGGPSRVAVEWRGDAAMRIASILNQSRDSYPYRERYLPWPGPNSNTFVAWVLEQAGIERVLDWKAFGRNYGKRGRRT